ncbi:MAG: tetratricopeptide repeat protein [Planctomycetes bacterium]|nr:tetratricopeptide repeat protein [Planctomycetota bacterium]
MDIFTKQLEKAEAYFLSGRIDDAETEYLMVLQTNPTHYQALYSLGTIAYRRGNVKAAIDLVERAIDSRGKLPKFHNTLGLLLEEVGQTEKALNCYKTALAIKPDYAEAHHNIAIINLTAGDFETACENAKKAVTAAPAFAQAYNTLGYCRQQLGHLRDAAVLFQKAAELKPDYAEAYNHLGVLLTDQSNYIEAVNAFQKAIYIDPEYAELYNNMAIAKKGLCAFDEAIENYRKASEMDPAFYQAFNNLANSLRDKGRCAEAIENYTRAIEINPNYADAYWNRSLAMLLSDDLAEGFSQYQWRREPSLGIVTYPHTYDKPRWDGRPINGKTLLIHYEQGFGDNIQFIRYLPKLKELGATVLFEARKPMLDLLKDFPGIDRLVEAKPQSGVTEDFDFYAALMDLPAIFQTTLETIPASIPYLFADKDKSEKWKDIIGEAGYKVGIVWAGKPTHGNDANRSCKLNNFAPISKIDGVKLFSLQKGDAAKQIAQFGIEIENVADYLENFADTAAAIENLDLVISVDTAVLHLAAAMGKPTWALIQFSPDWRWLLNRSDSPWYPTLKLFRQKKYADWKEVFKEVTQELKIIKQKPETQAQG